MNLWQGSSGFLLYAQVRCYSETSDDRSSTDTKFRRLQLTQEEREQRSGKHEILNVAEHDLEGSFSALYAASCFQGCTQSLHSGLILTTFCILKQCLTPFFSSISLCCIAQQQASTVDTAAGFCSALPDDEESEECWNAYQYYEDKRVCTPKL